MESDPIDFLYRQPLLANALLLAFPGLAYWYLCTHLVSYGRGLEYPDTKAYVVFYATFWLFPFFNLFAFFRALLCKHTRLAFVYALLSLFTFLSAYGLWCRLITSFHKIGG